MKQTLATGLAVPVVALAFAPDGKTLAAAAGLVGDARDGSGASTGELRLLPLGR